MNSEKTVGIIGGGLAGLAAARYLQKNGISFQLFEKDEKLGGRVSTHEIDGFLLDEGFQVLLDNYEEVHQLIDFKQLHAYKSPAGAMIHINNRWQKLANPLESLSNLLPTLQNEAGSFLDKVKILNLARKINAVKDPWLEVENVSTQEYLVQAGFSDSMINKFFKPFFGGVFLDWDLDTAAPLFVYLFQKFFSGKATLPEKGMQQLVQLIAAPLPTQQIHLNSEVKKIERTSIQLATGASIDFDYVIIASNNKAVYQGKWNGTQCFYFSSDPVDSKNLEYLYLNPQKGKVRHVSFLNHINPLYAPAGKNLLSITVEADALVGSTDVKKEVEVLLQKKIKNLEFLKSFSVPQALPFFNGSRKEISINTDQQIIVGDHTTYPSINGALASGRAAAELISSRVLL